MAKILVQSKEEVFNHNIQGGKMHDRIDQLLIDGKKEEAILLIERVWEKERQAENKIIADLSRKIEGLEKHKEAAQK